MWQESVPVLPQGELGVGVGAGADSEEEVEEGADDYEGREDELDAPRDYDDYSENAHTSRHHD